MDRIRIVGGRPLNGTIPISGAKNATLPLMIASLLTEETLVLDNVPRLADVGAAEAHPRQPRRRRHGRGKRAGRDRHRRRDAAISAARHRRHDRALRSRLASMRASFWVIAPLVARMGEARVSLPGGCAIGTRPVDLFIMALERLGAEIEIDAGYVIARAPKGLSGARDRLPQGHGRRHPHHADGGVARAGARP